MPSDKEKKERTTASIQADVARELDMVDALFDEATPTTGGLDSSDLDAQDPFAGLEDLTDISDGFEPIDIDPSFPPPPIPPIPAKPRPTASLHPRNLSDRTGDGAPLLMQPEQERAAQVTDGGVNTQMEVSLSGTRGELEAAKLELANRGKLIDDLSAQLAATRAELESTRGSSASSEELVALSTKIDDVEASNAKLRDALLRAQDALSAALVDDSD